MCAIKSVCLHCIKAEQGKHLPLQEMCQQKVRMMDYQSDGEHNKLVQFPQECFLCFAAPLTGPHINTTVKDGRILVSWREIPPDEQMGCIVSYKIYLQKQAAAMPPDIYSRYS